MIASESDINGSPCYSLSGLVYVHELTSVWETVLYEFQKIDRDMAIAEPTSDKAPAADEPKGNLDEADAPSDRIENDLVESDLLVEDVSIDGMCGVY
jgi:mycofactocin precursor